MTKRILIGTNTPEEKLCPRCGSKMRVGKTWKEKMAMFDGGTRIVTYSEKVCSNKECQDEFDKQRRLETKKLKEAKKKRDELANARKEKIAKKSKKSSK